MNIHQGGKGLDEQINVDISVDKMKRYISYCKS
jgi:DNA replication licensing factor MCM5